VGVWKHGDCVCVNVCFLGHVEWCECECGCVGGGGSMGMCVFADGGVGCVCGVWCDIFVWCGVRQLEQQQPRCGGRSCDVGRRAAFDVAEDVAVRVGLDGVMGVWVW
jgi:hypothetical protein